MDKQLSITESLSQSGLEAIDYLILLIYIAMLISLGFFLNYSRENKSKDKTAANYFLAGNTLTW
jgi:SSS family solute:Na+ symporter